MKLFWTLPAFLFLALSANAAKKPLNEILKQDLKQERCVPPASLKAGEADPCTKPKGTTSQASSLKKAAAAAKPNQDEFEAFENEEADLSHVNETEAEIEIE